MTEIYEMINFYYIVEILTIDEDSYKIKEYFIPKDNPQLFRFTSSVIIENDDDVETIATNYKKGLCLLATLFDKVFNSSDDKKTLYIDLYSDLKSVYQVDLEAHELYR